MKADNVMKAAMGVPSPSEKENYMLYLMQIFASKASDVGYVLLAPHNLLK